MYVGMGVMLGSYLKRYRKQLTKLGVYKALRSRPCAAMSVVSFANYTSSALFHDLHDSSH